MKSVVLYTVSEIHPLSAPSFPQLHFFWEPAKPYSDSQLEADVSVETHAHTRGHITYRTGMHMHIYICTCSHARTYALTPTAVNI